MSTTAWNLSYADIEAGVTALTAPYLHEHNHSLVVDLEGEVSKFGGRASWRMCVRKEIARSAYDIAQAKHQTDQLRSYFKLATKEAEKIKPLKPYLKPYKPLIDFYLQAIDEGVDFADWTSGFDQMEFFYLSVMECDGVAPWWMDGFRTIAYENSYVDATSVSGPSGATVAARPARGVSGLTFGQPNDNSFAVSATGYLHDQTLHVSGDPTGLPLPPRAERGWVGGQHVYTKNATNYNYSASWSVTNDPVVPAADTSVQVRNQVSACLSGGSSFSDVVGQIAYYSNPYSGSYYVTDIKSWRDLSCGSPWVATSSIPTKNGNYVLTRIDAFDQNYVGSDGCGAVLAPSKTCYTWYPAWSAQRPPTYDPGDGTLTRWGVCMTPDVSSTRIESTWSGNITTFASYDVPDLTCAPGSTLDSFGVDWTPAAPGSQSVAVVPPTLNAPSVREIPSTYPDCAQPGACFLELSRVVEDGTRSCGYLGAECPDWYLSATRDQEYRCSWGAYEVPVRACSALRDPGTVRGNGHYDSDGTAVLDQWPALELDSQVIARLRDTLTARDGDQSCEAVGEAARSVPGASELAVPDVVSICRDFGLPRALEFIRDTLGPDTGPQAAVDILTHAASAPLGTL